MGSCLSTLAPLNVSAAFAKGQTALCIGTGDNDGFYSVDGGENWKTQEYFQGDNDCCFVDPLLPSRLLVFARRSLSLWRRAPGFRLPIRVVMLWKPAA